MIKNELSSVITQSINEALSNMHTSTIAIVTKVNAKTINVKPVINRTVKGETIELPEFVEVLPLFMQGGGSYTTYPITVGDYCLLVMTERCFDRWFSGEDFVSPPEVRMHDYSDSIAIVGLNPLASLLDIPTKIKQVGDFEVEGDGEYTGDLTITGDLTVNGNINCTGTVTGTVDVIGGGVSLKNHVHYVTSAPGSTNPPT